MPNRIMTTEQRNPKSQEMDDLAVESILKLMNDEDRRVPVAINEAMPEIVAATEVLVETWNLGGRWIYVGAGTSGRIAALDAAECPTTFGVPSDRVLAVVAGGDKAATHAVEGVEDDWETAIQDLESLYLRPEDAVVGLTASGYTPYVVSAVQHASDRGCSTVVICNNPGSRVAEIAQIGIEVITGPEVLTGSTRLKAGTSQKLVLNMLSTAAFTRLGKVYENLMVDVQASNEKLRKRARRIVCEASGVGEEDGEELLLAAEGSVKLAIVMSKGECSLDEARTSLEKANGNTRQALRDT